MIDPEGMSDNIRVRSGRDVCDALVHRIVELEAPTRGWVVCDDVNKCLNASANATPSSPVVQVSQAVNVRDDDLDRSQSHFVGSSMAAAAAFLGHEVTDTLSVKASVELPITSNQAVALYRSSNATIWSQHLVNFEVIECFDDDTFVVVEEYRVAGTAPRVLCSLYHFCTLSSGVEVITSMPVQHPKFQVAPQYEQVHFRCAGWVFRDVEGGRCTVSILTEACGTVVTGQMASAQDFLGVGTLLGLFVLDFGVYVTQLVHGSENEILRRQALLLHKEMRVALTNPAGPSTRWQQIFDGSELPPGTLLPGQTVGAFVYSPTFRASGVSEKHCLQNIIDIKVKCIVNASLDSVRANLRDPVSTPDITQHGKVHICSDPSIGDVSVVHFTRDGCREGIKLDFCLLSLVQNIGDLSSAVSAYSVLHPSFEPISGALRVNLNMAGCVASPIGDKVELRSIIRLCFANSIEMGRSEERDWIIEALASANCFLRFLEQKRSTTEAPCTATLTELVSQPPVKRAATTAEVTRLQESSDSQLLSSAPFLRLNANDFLQKLVPEVSSGPNDGSFAIILGSHGELSCVRSSLLDCLPDSLLVHIFQYLSLATLCRLQLVSRRTRRIARTDDLWKTFFFERQVVGWTNASPPVGGWRDAVAHAGQRRKRLAELTVTADVIKAEVKLDTVPLKAISVEHAFPAIDATTLACVSADSVRLVVCHAAESSGRSSPPTLRFTIALPEQDCLVTHLTDAGDIWLGFKSGVVVCFGPNSLDVRAVTDVHPFSDNWVGMRFVDGEHILCWDTSAAHLWTLSESRSSLGRILERPQFSSRLLGSMGGFSDDVTCATGWKPETTAASRIFAVLGCRDGSLGLFDTLVGCSVPAPSGNCMNSIVQWSQGAPVCVVSCCSRTNAIIAGDTDGVVCIWQMQAQSQPILVQRLSKHLGPVTSITADLEFTVTGGEDGVIRAWARRRQIDQSIIQRSPHAIIHAGVSVPALVLHEMRLIAGLGSGFLTVWDF